MIDHFDARFPAGPPGLRACDSLTVEGDITFGSNVTIQGSVRIKTIHGPVTIADGATITEDLTL